MRKRTLQIALTVAAVALLYFGLFFGTRDYVFVTDYDEDFAYTVKFYYFSQNSTANAVMFYLFYPVHVFIGRPYYSMEVTQQAFDEYQGQPYYLFDPAAIKW